MILAEVLLILFCLLGAAFFAGIETGVISINRMRLRHQVEHGDRPARILEWFLEQPDRLLGTTLVGVNLCMVVASIMSASIGEALFASWGEAVLGVLMTLVILIFCEYLPKAWFQSQPLRRCRLFAWPLRWTSWFLRPLADAMTWITQWMLPAAGREAPARPLFSTKDEIDLLAQESEEHGTLSPKQRIMIRRVFELSNKTAKDIMTPRARMAFVRKSAGVPEVYAAVRESRHVRFPVCDDAGGFLGTVSFFDVVSECEPERRDRFDGCIRPPLFVRESAPIMEIFSKMRLTRQDMCLVTDAQSQVVGLITSQNVLEEIVGKL